MEPHDSCSWMESRGRGRHGSNVPSSATTASEATVPDGKITSGGELFDLYWIHMCKE